MGILHPVTSLSVLGLSLAALLAARRLSRYRPLPPGPTQWSVPPSWVLEAEQPRT